MTDKLTCGRLSTAKTAPRHRNEGLSLWDSPRHFAVRSGRRDGTRLRSLATDSAASPLAGAACEERSCFKAFFVTVRQGR